MAGRTRVLTRVLMGYSRGTDGVLNVVLMGYSRWYSWGFQGGTHGGTHGSSVRVVWRTRRGPAVCAADGRSGCGTGCETAIIRIDPRL